MEQNGLKVDPCVYGNIFMKNCYQLKKEEALVVGLEKTGLLYEEKYNGMQKVTLTCTENQNLKTNLLLEKNVED